MKAHWRRGPVRTSLLPAIAITALALSACGGGGGIVVNENGGATAGSQLGVTLLAKVSDTPVEGGMVDSVYKVQVINGPDAVTVKCSNTVTNKT